MCKRKNPVIIYTYSYPVTYGQLGHLVPYFLSKHIILLIEEQLQENIKLSKTKLGTDYSRIPKLKIKRKVVP